MVEDNFLICESLCAFLIDCGCEVIGPAARVDAALSLCESARIDGAFLDINLGHETSLPIADRLRQQGVPFIFLTGYGDLNALPARHAAVLRLGKPFNYDEIVRVAGAQFRSP